MSKRRFGITGEYVFIAFWIVVLLVISLLVMLRLTQDRERIVGQAELAH